MHQLRSAKSARKGNQLIAIPNEFSEVTFHELTPFLRSDNKIKPFFKF